MNLSQLTEYDTFLFHQGTNCKAYEMLGAHITEENGQQGVRFSVWAPNAKSVSVVGLSQASRREIFTNMLLCHSMAVLIL